MNKASDAISEMFETFDKDMSRGEDDCKQNEIERGNASIVSMLTSKPESLREAEIDFART
jgi:hypothetical protein